MQAGFVISVPVTLNIAVRADGTPLTEARAKEIAAFYAESLDPSEYEIQGFVDANKDDELKHATITAASLELDPKRESSVWQQLPAEGEHRCDNCASLWSADELITPIPDYDERVDDGGAEPSGECPECGALCYPIEGDALSRVSESELQRHADEYGEDPGHGAGGACILCNESHKRNSAPVTPVDPHAYLDRHIAEQQASHAAAGITPADFAAAAEYGEQDEVADANDDPDNPTGYINHYRCNHEGRLEEGQPVAEWSDEWDSMCNDECPVCQAEIEPYESEDATA